MFEFSPVDEERVLTVVCTYAPDQSTQPFWCHLGNDLPPLNLSGVLLLDVCVGNGLSVSVRWAVNWSPPGGELDHVSGECFAESPVQEIFHPIAGRASPIILRKVGDIESERAMFWASVAAAAIRWFVFVVVDTWGEGGREAEKVPTSQKKCSSSSCGSENLGVEGVWWGYGKWLSDDSGGGSGALPTLSTVGMECCSPRLGI